MINIEEHIPLAASCARRFVGRGIEYDDLFQIASEALVKAAARFDPSKGVRFSSYAVPTILGEIKSSFRNHGMIKVSRSSKDIARRVKSVSAELTQQRGVAPTINEICNILNISEEAVAEAVASTSTPLSLDELTESERLASDELGHFIDERIDLAGAISKLDPESMRIIHLRLVLQKSQAEVARVFGTSQVTVSRKERIAKEKLKAMLT